MEGERELYSIRNEMNLDTNLPMMAQNRVDALTCGQLKLPELYKPCYFLPIPSPEQMKQGATNIYRPTGSFFYYLFKILV